MGKSRKLTRFLINETYCEFDSDALKNLYNYKSESEQKLKKAIIDEIAKATVKTESSVNGWLKGYNGPSDLDAVKQMAKVLGCDYLDLLRKCKSEENKMKETYFVQVEEHERDAARKIYSMMCDIIDGIRFIEYETRPGDPEPMPMLVLYADIEYIEKARSKFLLELKKLSFDLPLEIRNALKDLVNDCFGPYENTTRSFGIFAAIEYKEFLNEKGWSDSMTSRIKYCLYFQRLVDQRVNKLLENYMGK